MFKIILSKFSMWYFNSVLIFFRKQKQISLGVECYILEEFGRDFFFLSYGTCGAKPFSSFSETWRWFFSFFIRVVGRTSCSLWDHFHSNFILIFPNHWCSLSLTMFFYRNFYLFFASGCRWKNHAKRSFLIVYPNSVWGRKQEYLKSWCLWAWLSLKLF